LHHAHPNELEWPLTQLSAAESWTLTIAIWLAYIFWLPEVNELVQIEGWARILITKLQVPSTVCIPCLVVFLQLSHGHSPQPFGWLTFSGFLMRVNELQMQIESRARILNTFQPQGIAVANAIG